MSEQPSDQTRGTRARGRVVRVPRMVPFLGSGALLGILLAGYLVFFGPEDDREGSAAQDFVLLALVFGLLGGLLAGAIYLVVERIARR